MSYSIIQLRGRSVSEAGGNRKRYSKPQDYIYQMQINKLKNQDVKFAAQGMKNMVNFEQLKIKDSELENKMKSIDKSLLVLLFFIFELEKKMKINIDIPINLRDKLKEINKPLLDRVGVDFFKEITSIDSSSLGS